MEYPVLECRVWEAPRIKAFKACISVGTRDHLGLALWLQALQGLILQGKVPYPTRKFLYLPLSSVIFLPPYPEHPTTGPTPARRGQ